MIEVREVKTRKEINDFVDFPIKLYKGNPYFVPPLRNDEVSMFKKSYVYRDQTNYICFNAYKDGKMVGRIQAINQKVANEKWNETKVRFTRFDSIDDQEVANALFDKAAEWARSEGLDTLCGPLGFSDLEREGLLVYGFDEPQTFEEQYNYEYYQRLVENYGFVKEVGWTESQIRLPEEIDPKIERVANIVEKRYKLHLNKSKNTRQFIKKYKDQFFDILDQTYVNIYGTVPFTDKMKKMMIDNFKLIIKMDYVILVLDENDRAVAFGLCFPSMATAFQKSGGRLTPAALIRFLKETRNPKVLDLGLIGVLPEYESKGVVGVVLNEFIHMLQRSNVEYCETNLNLETNDHVVNLWKSFDRRIHKKRTSYIKKI